MNKKELIKKLGKNLLCTFLISSVLTFFFIEIVYSKETGSLEGNQGVFLMVIGGVIWSLMLTISSGTTFLNVHPAISNNKINQWMSFFLLPCLVMLSAFFSADIYGNWKAFITMTLPFIITHTYFFISFLKFKKSFIINHNL